MLSSVSLGSYRAFAAVQDGHGVTKKVDRHFVHRARFFANRGLGVSELLLFRVPGPIRSSSVKVLRENRFLDTVMSAAGLGPLAFITPRTVAAPFTSICVQSPAAARATLLTPSARDIAIQKSSLVDRLVRYRHIPPPQFTERTQVTSAHAEQRRNGVSIETIIAALRRRRRKMCRLSRSALRDLPPSREAWRCRVLLRLHR